VRSFDGGRLGREVRRLRAARGLTLRDIERAEGISATHVSAIERGRTSPTVNALRKIAAALDVRVTQLLDAEGVEASLHVVRADRGRRLELPEEGAALRTLSAAPGVATSVVDVTLPCGSGTSLRRAAGEDVVVALSGRLAFACEGDQGVLEAGDVVHVRARTPLRITNAGDGEARALWFTTPRIQL